MANIFFNKIGGLFMKRLFTVVIGLGAAAIFCACSGASGNSASASAANTKTAEPIVLKLSNHTAVDAAQSVGVLAAGEAIKASTGGQVDLQLYHSGQLSPQESIIVDTQTGQIDMCLAGPSQMGQVFTPISILGAPYLFIDLEHMYAAAVSDSVQKLFKDFEKETRLVILDYWALGGRNVSSNKLARNPDEFSLLKMRSATAPMYVTAIKCMGANPTPIALNETYLALQTGTVDAQENPLNLILAQKFYEVQKYIIITEHMIDGFAVTINSGKWNSIPADLQQKIRDGLNVGRGASDAVILEKDAEALVVFKDRGLEIVYPDKTPFIAKAMEAAKGFEKDGTWYPGMFQEIAGMAKK
jgi:tripartite ATP-independent transporter DctP family solute receptor